MLGLPLVLGQPPDADGGLLQQMLVVVAEARIQPRLFPGTPVQVKCDVGTCGAVLAGVSAVLTSTYSHTSNTTH